MAEGYGVKVVDEPTFDVPRHELGNHLLELAQTVEGIEGWVVQFEDGDMVKLKTKWYMDRHHAMTFLRVRDIAGMVLSESLDDLKAKLVGDGIDISEILSIEHEVVQCLNDISVAVHSLHLANQHLPIKEVAIKFKGHEYFGLLMSRINGREPKIKEYFKKHHLKARFDLRQINLLQSVADTEE
jgi:kynurenine formamidase